MQTNPVQQRMEYLADVWNDLPKKKYNMIRVLIPDRDEQMLDAFYQYMLGIDTTIPDIEIMFESDFIDGDVFSDALVKELLWVVNLWNNTDFSGSDEINKKMIDWEPDYQVSNPGNRAALFVENMNRLVESFDLHPRRCVVANLYLYPGDTGIEKDRLKWLKELLELDFHPQFKVMITDKKESQAYRKLADDYHREVYTWEPDIDTGNVVSKVAAMGDPQEPDTAYRLAYVKMMKAISLGKYRQTCKEARTCLVIAEENVENNPQWLSQVMMIHLVLSNEHYRNDHKEKAFEEADTAILRGSLIPPVSGEITGCAVYAQALLHKATLLCYEKHWKEAWDLYRQAAENYVRSQVWIPALDSYRMAGLCAHKNGRYDWALESLVQGYRLSNHMDDKTLQGTTFHILLAQLLKLDYQDEISDEELNRKATALYGEDWKKYLQDYSKRPDFESLYTDNPYLVTEEE